MDWLWVAVLCIMWAAILLPVPRREVPKTFPDLKLNMELRTDTSQPGRWVLAPRKGARFLGPQERARVRARERRRRVFLVLLEAMALTALIGLFPPLRAMLLVTAALGLLLLAYVGLVLRMVVTRRRPVDRMAEARPSLTVVRAAPPAAERLVAVGRR